ncbi:ankyrin repeat protein, partial [Baffinella frigidus]
KDKSGSTPLHCASHHGHTALVSLLLEHGASAVVVDNCGRSCLHWAAHLGWEVIAELLLEAGADLSAKDLSGRTPQDIAQ